MADIDTVLEALRHCLPTTKKDGVLTCDTCPYYRCDDGVRLSVTLIEDIRKLLKSQPKIVRCKDCKHWLSPGIGYKNADLGTCYGRGHNLTKSDWFCADGERK